MPALTMIIRREKWQRFCNGEVRGRSARGFVTPEYGACSASMLRPRSGK